MTPSNHLTNLAFISYAVPPTYPPLYQLRVYYRAYYGVGPSVGCCDHHHRTPDQALACQEARATAEVFGGDVIKLDTDYAMRRFIEGEPEE